MSNGKPNARFDHIFVVLRQDAGGIAGTRACWTEDEAEAEASRLNAVNQAN